MNKFDFTQTSAPATNLPQSGRFSVAAMKAPVTPPDKLLTASTIPSTPAGGEFNRFDFTVGKPSVNPLNIPKDIAQSVARVGASTALTLTNTPELAPDTNAPPLEQRVRDIIFGKGEVLKSFATRIAEGEQKAHGFGAGKASLPLAFAGVLGGDALNFLGGESEATKFISTLAAETDVAKVTESLIAKGFAKDIAETYAPKIAGTTDKKIVEEAIQKASDLQLGTKAVTEAPAVIPEAKTPLGQAVNLAKDTANIKTNTELNVDNLAISDTGKKVIQTYVENIKPQIEDKVGHVLTNQEVIDFAENSSKVLNKAVSRDITLQWESSMLKARQALAQAAETGKVDQSFIDALMTIKTQGTDIARKLQSLSISANPEDVTSTQAIFEAVLKATKNSDEVIQAAKGVDFNDFNQASKFYRQFISPKMSEWVDLIRYNSMLSSPKTHIINAFSNLVNSIVVAPIEKFVSGGLDFIGSGIKGIPRSQFSGEAGAYLKGYFSNVDEAITRFSQTMQGQKEVTQLDLKNIPIATEGLKGKVVSFLDFPIRLLEASDQYFSALTKAGEKAALEFRAAKGIPVANMEAQAEESAAYRLFREQLHSKNQGQVLDAIDTFTSKLQMLRNSKNPIVSTISKFTVPFLRTPMNIFKQGIEYSPLGFLTVPGSKNATEQIAKAAIGSAVFGVTSTLAASNRLTFDAPTNQKKLNEFKAAGMQPYSIKIGDTWYSYQKLPPPLAYPLALTAAIYWTEENKKADTGFTEAVLTGIAKYGQFLADQSYAKNFGDLLTAVQGGESGIATLIGNYPQQLIPLRALSGWFARLADDSARKVDPKGTFIDKQIQGLMMNIPGLSQEVPARIDPNTNLPVKTPNNIINAFSPVDISVQTRKFKYYLNHSLDVGSPNKYSF